MRKLIDRNDVLGAGYLIPEPEGFVDYERDEPELVRRSVEDWMDMQVEFGRVRVKQEGDDGDGGFEVLETRGEGKPDIASSELLSEVAKDDIEQWSEIAETPSPKTVDDPAVAGPDVEDSETYVEDQLNATASSELSSGMAEDDMERRLEIAETLSPATVDDVIAVPENEDTAVARELPKENDEEQKKSEGDDHDYTTQ